MIELTAEMIIEIHDTTIQRYGGLPGILCQGTIDYLVTRINDEPDHFKKAALALHLIALHLFNDGPEENRISGGRQHSENERPMHISRQRKDLLRSLHNCRIQLHTRRN
jgi:hypothetical protein